MRRLYILIFIFTSAIIPIVFAFNYTLENFLKISIYDRTREIINASIQKSLSSVLIYSDDMNGANDTNSLKARGYKIFYRGTGPQGTSATWFQGQPSKFPAYNGPTNGYVASDYNVVTGQNNIDCWLILPRMTGGILVDDSLYFYSRSEQGNPYADSIRVMFSITDSIPEGAWTEIGRYKANTSGIWEKRGFKAVNSSINGHFAIRYCMVNGGPTGQNSDYIGIDAITIIRASGHPVITYTPLGNCPKLYWPSKVICQVEDNSGVDSVWVRWKINNGLYNRFNLSYGAGNNWSNFFNSTPSQIFPGDSIFYRIIAQNKGGYKDSTSLYKLYILSQPCSCIDTGTYGLSFPFNKSWMHARSDVLYKASEIISNGGSAGYIYGLSYNFVNTIGLPIPNFNLQIQNTTDTVLYGFTYLGWTTCYSGVYAIPGTGWQNINLTTPFYWDGVQNLIIKICFDDNSGGGDAKVKSTYKSNFMMYTNGCSTSSCNACMDPWIGSPTNYRPNICFTILPDLVNIGNGGNRTPDNYTLFQNYPNPFNPITKIKYDIPKQGFVKIIIYDLLGREVSQLVNQEKSFGTYIIDFDGSNLTSGIYFYKLKVNNFTDVKKMILIK